MSGKLPARVSERSRGDYDILHISRPSGSDRPPGDAPMPTIYLIRHAEAVPHGDPNHEDDARPLLDIGRKQARQLGESLAARGIHFDAVFSSPLPRALSTAEELLAGMKARESRSRRTIRSRQAESRARSIGCYSRPRAMRSPLSAISRTSAFTQAG